jgi:hypothetical protein
MASTSNGRPMKTNDQLLFDVYVAYGPINMPGQRLLCIGAADIGLDGA